MDENGQKLKMQLVWASVFMMVFGAWGFSMLIATGGGTGTAVMGLCMTLGILLSFLTVPLLLIFAGAGRSQLVAGRILVALQGLCHVSAMGVAVAIIVESIH